MKFVKTAAAVLAAGFAVGAASLPAAAQDSMLQFQSDGTFQILILTDIHETQKPFQDSLAMIHASLEAANPDLVVYLGDNIAGAWKDANEDLPYETSYRNVESAIDQIVQPVVSRNVPFAVVFGNHDHESGVSREEQMEIYQRYPGCVAVDEGDALPGCGTYNLTIKSSDGKRDAFSLWFFDSGSWITQEWLDRGMTEGYAAVEPAQIEWFELLSQQQKRVNGGRALPGLAFQHIPVPEVYHLFEEVPKGTEGAVKGQEQNWRDKYYKIADPQQVTGKLGEGPCPPCYNTGEFAAMKRQGNILGAFFGHDHVNDYCGQFDGIYLAATKSAGVRSYGDGTGRGVRTVTLHESDLTVFDTQTYYFSDLVADRLSHPLTGNLSYFQQVDILKYALAGVGVLVVCVGALTAGIVLYRKKKQKKLGETPSKTGK